MLNRSIFFCNENIDEINSTEAIEKLLTLDQESNEDITIYINSYGGSISDGFALYDAIQLIKSDVKTISMGSSYSMGALLTACGTPGKRVAWPNTLLMVHGVRNESKGDLTDFRENLRMMELRNDMFIKALTRHSTMSFDEVEKMIVRDTYLTALEAKELGLIDEIL